MHQNINLSVKNVTHCFDYPLFENISLDINKKESIAIMGVSGSGKSTLLNIFCALLKPKNGEVFFNGTDIFSLTKKKLLNIVKDNFGIIFQAHYLFRGFSAFENLQITSLLTHNNIDEELIKKMGLDLVINQPVGDLSGGQQQRLSIARVLTKEPNIIFADEPTGNLDNQTAHDVMNILFDYVKNNNASMVLVTHDQSIANMCDKVYELKNNVLKVLK